MPTPPEEAGVQAALARAFAALRMAREEGAELVASERGRVTAVTSGIVRVAGLPGVGAEELVAFPHGAFGLALDLGRDEVGVALLDARAPIAAGDEATRTGRVADVPVGDGVLGRVIDPLGRPLDGGGPLAALRRWPIERPAPAILDRAPVIEPLQTGIKVIDALIPIGRGQRELILGDRQTGKTAIALATILNQPDDVACVYCAIGQRGAAVARVVAVLREHGALERTAVVVAADEDAPGLRFVAPYAATAIAEFFMEAGRPALIVYDDLTRHARAYRELALLLRRPPGREAYPGDVFHIHARLLERATRLRPERGGGSLTALPIAETEAGNLATYVPTNLISITDGQIVLATAQFQLGQLPAVDVGLSVSRVGGQAQLPAYHAITGDLKLAHAQFEELELFARFGTRVDDETRRRLAHGRRLRQVLAQAERATMPVVEQIAVLDALVAGLFDDVPEARMEAAELQVRLAAAALPPAARQALLDASIASGDALRGLRAAADAALIPFRAPG